MALASRAKDKKAAYLDPQCNIEARIRDLLGRMTLEEKVRQMGYTPSRNVMKDGKFSLAMARKAIGKLGIGGLEDSRLEGKLAVRAANAIQEYLAKNTRLGIPALIMAECLHGHMSMGATIFPQAIALASTWDTDLIGQVATVAAKEARAVGVSQALSPDLDLARDPRWGRVEETYGEDPYLAARLGVAYIKGIQGEGPVIDGEHLIATPKHFAAHGSPESGVNLAPVAVGPRELRDLYLVPFKAAIVEAGALSLMNAYSEVDGVPAASSKLLLTKILREEWGFMGYTFSDYGSIHMLVSCHKTAADLAEAGRQALEAGMDLEAPSEDCFGQNLVEAVRKGELSVDLIDRAATRILRVKFLAGLFERPYADPKRAAEVINTPVHRQLARRTAQESIVLLKNAGDLLPLDKNVREIAVIGPNADQGQCGDYTIVKNEIVTPLAGIRSAVSKRTKVTHAKGCELCVLSKDGFADAVTAAEEADVAILVVGGSSMALGGIGWGGEDWRDHPTTCGEGFDRAADLNLPGVQQDLVEAVVATGTPTVVVLVNGRPYSIGWIAENVPAVLEAWYPGEEGGNALADIIFGKVNPSGKLPISFPRTVGHVPVFYNHKPSARGHYHQPGAPDRPGRDYVFMETTPLYEFGHGLSYTKFKYSNLRVSPPRIAPAGNVTVSVNLHNAGQRAGKEVVQLYVNDMVSSVTTPVKALRAFRKISLGSGETKTVEFTLGPDDLSLLDEHMERVVEPGWFELLVGGLTKRFEVR